MRSGREAGRYILDGHTPVVCDDLYQWAIWLENGDRAVAKTGNDDLWVSTVFLGLDHRFGGRGPPLLFETMVFGGPLNGEMARYSSWDDAEAGHRAMARRVFGKAAAQ